MLAVYDLYYCKVVPVTTTVSYSICIIKVLKTFLATLTDQRLIISVHFCIIFDTT